MARWLFILGLAVPSLVLGQVTDTITSMAVTNYSGYVLESDLADDTPGYHREHLMAQSIVRSTNNSGSLAITGYSLSYRLLDSTSQPHPIFDSTGETNATYTHNTTNLFFLAGNSAINATNVALIRPATRLDPYQQYTLELKIFKGATDTGQIAFDGPRTYYHYTNVVSGDALVNVIPILDNSSYTRTYLVKTVPSKNSFTISPQFTLRRWDDFNSAVSSANIPVRFTYELRDAATDAVIPLKANVTVFSAPIENYFLFFGFKLPRVKSFVENIPIEPADGVQLDSVNNTYKVNLTISHHEHVFLPPTIGNSMAMPSQRLLHFNGKLFFGPIETQFTSIANDPAVITLLPDAVRSTLAVNGNSGFVVGKPTHTYGDGTALSVNLRANGDADLNAGSVTLNAPAPDNDTLSNVRFRRFPVTLSTTGASANLRATLPAGFGYRFDTASRILRAAADFNGATLNQSLRPVSNLDFSGPLYACEETKPLWIEASSMRWVVNEGRFLLMPTGAARYVRADELDTLEAAPGLVEADMRFKRSNEQHFRFLDQITSANVDVLAHATGQARMTFTAAFVPGEFRTHFPYDVRIRWTGPGEMAVSGDQTIPGSSKLSGVLPAGLPYNRDCFEPDCGLPKAGPDTLELAVDGDELRFTPDGGLAAQGNLTAAKPLTWGYIKTINKYAQRTTPFAEANFHMPGFFLRGDQSALNTEKRAGVILLTGVQPSNLSQMERPETGGYLNGFADYAGLNFRVGSDGAKQGESVLGGVSSGLYPLRGRCKYYTRWAGVSGIHEAVFGSFPSSAVIYGYQVNFSNYGLSYLDSQNWESRTEGYVHVVSPSNIDQNFEELKFNCLGGLTDAKVPGNEAGLYKMLEYWVADFVTKAIKFDRKDGAECDPGTGFLVLGVQAHATHVDQPLFGLLGFRSNGNLITRQDDLLDDFDSRLKLPSNFKLKGPASEAYQFTPVADAYYNNYQNHPGVAQGFMNIAGKMDVPFFDDLKIHMHTGARTNDPSAPVYLMGGWPDKGWVAGSDHFFNNTNFDPSNRGFPTDVAVPGYRQGNSPSAEKYLVRAQRTWLGVVEFDYPLKWSFTRRAFESFKPVQNDLLVLSVEHQIKYLSAENAELTFGIQYSGMPQINIASMAFNAIDDATGVMNAFVQAGLGPARTAIEGGLGELEKILNDQLHAFFKTSFDQLLNPVVDNLYNALNANFNPATKSWTVAPGTTIHNYFAGGGGVPVASSITGRFKNVIGNSPLNNGVLKELDGNLLAVSNAIHQVQSILAEDGNGNRAIVANLTKKLIGELAAQFAGAILDDKLNAFLADADPTLDQIESVLGELKTLIGQLRGKIQAGGEFAVELQNKVNSLGAQIDSLTLQAENDVTAFFNGINISVDNPFQHYSAADIKHLIRTKLEDRFFGSTVASSIQVILKQRFYDFNASLREGIDSVFQQVNTTIRELLNESLAELDNSINGFLGDLSSVMGAGKLSGYAHINGDSLKLLRLDIYAQLQVPGEMEFNAFLQIKELDSNGTPTECLPASGKATEVTCGATDVSIKWISPDLRASIGAKFTFDPDPDGNPATKGIEVLTVGASFELKGALDFEAFKIPYLAASMAFGQLENYFSCAAQVQINQYKGFGGLFFGKTCTIDPIKLWDPDVADLLGTPPFTGAYVYVEVWIPISEALLGIPASCLFQVSAGAGTGAGYFVEGPTYVGKMLLGVSGDVLCIVSITGEVKLIGIKNADGLSLKGTGKLSGEIGFCPFCISFSKTLGLTYKNNKWDVDF